MWILLWSACASATGISTMVGPSELEMAKLALLDSGIQVDSPKATQTPEEEIDEMMRHLEVKKPEIEQPPHFESRECSPSPPSSPTASAPDSHFCFVGETRVLCRSQEGYLLRPISTIQPGEEVLTCALLSEGCELSVSKVEAVSAQKVECLMLVNLEERSLKCTPDHLFFVWPHGAWMPAKELCPGDLLMDMNGETCCVQETRHLKETDIVYNIETGENANYFANGILVHNCKIIKKVTPVMIAAGLGVAATSMEVTPAAMALGPVIPMAPVVSFSGASTGLGLAAGAATVRMMCEMPGVAPTRTKESLHRRPDRIAHHKDPRIGKIVRDPVTKHWWIKDAFREAGYKIFEECGPDLLRWIRDADEEGRYREKVGAMLEWIHMKDLVFREKKRGT
jgi:hypothetical protein